MEIILALIGVSGMILAAILTFVNVRRSNDLKKIELDQAQLKADQDREAAKRKEASEKHGHDMERVTTLEASLATLEASLAKAQWRIELLFRHNRELVNHIYEGKPPPPPDFPDGLFDK